MRELIEHSRAADRFGLWLCSVSLAIAGVAVATDGLAILRPAVTPSPAVIEISFSAPPAAPLEASVTEVPPQPTPPPPPLVEPAPAPDVALEQPEIAATPPEPAAELTDPLPAPPAEIEAQPPSAESIKEPEVAATPSQPKTESRPSPRTPRRTPSVESHVSSVAPARAVRQYRPRYPSSARRSGVTGTTQVLASVSASGRVTNASIARSSGSTTLDAEALRAIRRWRFSAARNAKGSAVASRVQIPIRFQLN